MPFPITCKIILPVSLWLLCTLKLHYSIFSLSSQDFILPKFPYKFRAKYSLTVSPKAVIIVTAFGDVPKWLKGPHSKCGRSGNRRESSNLSISVKRSAGEYCLWRIFFVSCASASYILFSNIMSLILLTLYFYFVFLILNIPIPPFSNTVIAARPFRCQRSLKVLIRSDPF